MRSRTILQALLVVACLGGCSERAARAPAAPSPVPPAPQPAPATRYDVTITVSGEGTVIDPGQAVSCSSQCSYSIAADTTLNLMQQPAAGYHFDAWSGACAAGQSCSLRVSGPLTIGAAFVEDASPPPPPAPIPGDTRVTIQVHGSGEVSAGIPFEPGAVADASGIRILSGTLEVAAFVRPLASYPDGSLRSALVQFDATPSQYIVDWTEPRTRNRPERPVRWVSSDDPLVGTVRDPAVFVTLPPAYLCRTGLRTPCEPVAGGVLDQAFVNFARTAVNDVNEPGYDVPLPYAVSSGFVDLSQSEPWLFDRANTFFALYARTGDLKWLRHAHRHAQKYAALVNSNGIFSLASYDHDLKYSYGWSPFIDYLLTGDESMLGVIARVAQAGRAEWQSTYSASTGFWTERHHAYALLSAVVDYEANGSADSLDYARSLMDLLVSMSANAAHCPLHTVEQHEGDSGDTRMMCSPWMGALLAEAVYRYWSSTGDDRAVEWLAGMGDYLVQHALYDGQLESPELAGLAMPWYLAGIGVRVEDGRGWGDMEHACDVAGLAARAGWAKRRLGRDSAAVLNATTSLLDTCSFVLDYWTRTTPTLPKYRLNPARKFNWWFGTSSDLTWLQSH